MLPTVTVLVAFPKRPAVVEVSRKGVLGDCLLALNAAIAPLNAFALQWWGSAAKGLLGMLRRLAPALFTTTKHFAPTNAFCLQLWRSAARACWAARASCRPPTTAWSELGLLVF